MRRRVLLATLTAGVLAGVSAYMLTCTFFSAWVFGYGQGDAGYAQKWRERLEPLADPEEACGRYPEVVAEKFENGEWIFGVCDDSHRSHWGGTIVVKDSRGQVRALFGHVCGPSFLKAVLKMQDEKSLQGFYSSRYLHSFHEYAFQ